MKRTLTCFPVRTLLLMGVVLLSSTGCRSRGSSHDDASVRLINAAATTQDLSISVDGQRVWRHSAFRSNTGFQGVGEGTYQVNIDAQVNGSRVNGRNYLLCQKGKAYTVIAINQGVSSSDPPGLRIFNEDKGALVPPGKVRLRFINVGENGSAVDVLFNNIVGFSDIPFGARTQALSLDPGVYALKMSQASDVLSLIAPVSFHFLPGHAYTLVAMGGRGRGMNPPSLSLVVYPDDQ